MGANVKLKVRIVKHLKATVRCLCGHSSVLVPITKGPNGQGTFICNFCGDSDVDVDGRMAYEWKGRGRKLQKRGCRRVCSQAKTPDFDDPDFIVIDSD